MILRIILCVTALAILGTVIYILIDAQINPDRFSRGGFTGISI